MFEEIRSLLAEQLDLDEEEITADTDITADLGADSLDIVEFLTTLESKYNIVIPQDSVKDVTTFGELVDVVKEIV